jgi:predicted metal-dependent hydrolase
MQLKLPLADAADDPPAVVLPAVALRPAPIPPAAIPPAPISPPAIPPVAAPPAHGVAAVEFVRTARARRYILRIRPDGTLRVTVPRWGSKREAREFIARQRAWIERERERVLAEHAPAQWRDGSEIWLRGERVRVSVAPCGDDVAIEYGGRTVVARADVAVRAAIERDLRSLARRELELRLWELAASHGLTPGRVSIRNQRSRWGSCAKDGAIALNFRLVQMPDAIRDYVLIHELMHIRQQNHSRAFWRLVEAACPGYREAERWLRVEGKALF